MDRTTNPKQRLLAAVDARRAVLEDASTTVCRIFNGRADGIDGLVIERFGEALIVQLHEERLVLAEPVVREVCALAAERLGSRSVYAKRYPRQRSQAQALLEESHRDPTPWIGAPAAAEIEVREHGLAFRIRPYDGYSVGLFADQRANRKRVRQLAKDKSVLNAFSYTCAFSIAAAAGQAAQTVSVDLSKRFLEWGRANFAANDIALDNHRFICSDIFDYYRRAGRQAKTFDLIILDPPTFSRTKGKQRPFVLADHLVRLVRGALDLLNPGGLLLLSTNHRGTSRGKLEEALSAAAAPQRAVVVERPRLPPDFRGDPDYAKSILARFG